MANTEFIEFWTTCASNGIIMEKPQIDSFERFRNELLEWNEKINLISRKDYDHILERHFLHSLSILKYVKLQDKAYCLDIGTGGGFPGIPLSIARPDLRMMLIDSIAKKIKTTGIFARHTGNRYLETLRARAEDLATNDNYLNHFDYTFARAVTKTASIIEWSLPLLKPDGTIILLKGGDLNEELDEARKMFPDIEIKEEQIRMTGCPWFETEEKKIVIVKSNSKQ